MTPAGGAEQISEAEHFAEAAEDVAEVGEDGGVEAGAGSRGAAHAREAEAIVGRALLGIREDGVRFGRLLEFLLGELIPGIAVGMVLERQLAVRALDFGFAGRPVDAEDVVVIALGRRHAFATLTIAGRSSRSPSM